MTTASQTKSSAVWAGVRKWLVRLGLIVGGLLAAWLFLEIGLRLASPLFPPNVQFKISRIKTTPWSPDPPAEPPLFMGDADLGMMPVPNLSNHLRLLFPTSSIAIHVVNKNWLNPQDRIGFRVPSADWEPKWPIDAVMIGDSYTYCFVEYEDCWVQHLAVQHGMSMVNLGMPTTGSVSHERVLETYGLPYQPRYVVWQWYNNDFEEDYTLATGTPPSKTLLFPTTKKTKLQRWLNANSIVYSEIDDYFDNLKVRAMNPDWFDTHRLIDGNLNMLIGEPYTRFSSDLSGDLGPKEFKVTTDYILKARDLLASKGMQLVIVLIPTKEEVYQRWTEPILGKPWLDSVSQGRKEMVQWCQDQKLMCLDATDTLKAHAEQREVVYWPEDLHLNVLGNQILADAVWNFLVQNGLEK